MNKLYNIFIHLVAICGVLGFVLFVQSIQIPKWLLVKSGSDYGISGIALVSQEQNKSIFLVVHDTKTNKNLPRFGMVTIKSKNRAVYTPLKLVNVADLPTDFEALTIVPSEKELSFMALTSYGKVYHIKLDLEHKNLSVIGTFSLPRGDSESNYESFALQKIDDVLLAAWADRGSETRPGVMSWGRLSLNDYNLTNEGNVNFKVPFPIKNVRHISDLKIDTAGVVYISAAMDSGNNGPFASAVYTLGSFCLFEDRIYFRSSKPFVILYRFSGHKVEAVELVPGATGGIILGSDDENQGGFLWLPDKS